MRAKYYWIPTSDDNGREAYASDACLAPVLVIQDAIKFNTKEECQAWIDKNPGMIEWKPKQHGFYSE